MSVLLTGTGRCARTGITAEVKGNMTRQIQKKHPLIQMLIDLGSLFLNGGHVLLCKYLLTSGVPLAGFGEMDSLVSGTVPNASTTHKTKPTST